MSGKRAQIRDQGAGGPRDTIFISLGGTFPKPQVVTILTHHGKGEIRDQRKIGPFTEHRTVKEKSLKKTPLNLGGLTQRGG